MVPVVSRIFDISSSMGLGIEGCRTCWKDEIGNHTLGMKANTNIIYYINDKMSDTAEVQNTYTKSLGSWAPQGRRLGDERLEVLVVLVAMSELPRVGRN